MTSDESRSGHRRTIKHPVARKAFVGGVVAISFVGLSGATPAAAHPLGNFSVNHLNSLTFAADRVIDDVVIDTAEIPTAQAKAQVDADGDGSPSDDELRTYGAARCTDFANDARLTVGDVPVKFTVVRSSFSYNPGQAGLTTSRLECRLEARVDLTVKAIVAFEDRYLPDRVGWHEINAVGDGAQIIESPVPQQSITDGLRLYPEDLLASPLDQRSATFDIQPGTGESTVAASARDRVGAPSTGFFAGAVADIQDSFNDLIGRRQLTLSVGLLAVGLALVLGASHALLPGHGKTVMAAYIAGRQGSVRDAIIVGATVTGTHTGGVLLLGLALTLSTSLAGESVLGWLGVTSGVMVAGLGIGLLVAAVRHKNTGLFGHGHSHSYDFDGEDAHGHSHGPGGHSHGPGGHSHEPGGHSHGPGGRSHGLSSHGHSGEAQDIAPAVRLLAPISTAGLAGTINRSELARAIVLGGDAGKRDDEATGSIGILAQASSTSATALPSALSGHSGMRVPTAIQATGPEPLRRVSRRGLIGMGIAGGLVPSPSALVILLSAIALGRTWFGILLVLGYGVGMAGTLTAAGVLLVKVRDRYQRRTQSSSGRLRSAARRWGMIAPYFTAALVLIVGLGLAIRSLGEI